MSTERQITANRANGAKSSGPVTPEGKLKSAANSARSTGPRTPAGKARASQNARRHGLYAEAIVLTSESTEMFTEILAEHEADLRPEGGVEQRFVETMVSSEWCRRRLLSMEKEQLEMEMERQQNAALESFVTPAAPAAELSGREPSSSDPAVVEINPARLLVHAFNAINAESRTAELRSRYENRCDRSYLRSLKALREYRAEKRRVSADVQLAEKREKDRIRKQIERRARTNAKKS